MKTMLSTIPTESEETRVWSHTSTLPFSNLTLNPRCSCKKKLRQAHSMLDQIYKFCWTTSCPSAFNCNHLLPWDYLEMIWLLGGSKGRRGMWGKVLSSLMPLCIVLLCLLYAIYATAQRIYTRCHLKASYWRVWMWMQALVSGQKEQKFSCTLKTRSSVRFLAHTPHPLYTWSQSQPLRRQAWKAWEVGSSESIWPAGDRLSRYCIS